MKVFGRFTWHFLSRLIIMPFIYLLIYLIIGIVFMVTEFPIANENHEPLLSSNPRNYISEVSNFTEIDLNNKVKIHDKVVADLQKKKAWLQVLNDSGDEIYQYRRPDMFPTHYSQGLLTDYKNNRISSPYDLYVWAAKINDKNYVWVLGIPNAELWIQKIQSQTTLKSNQAVLSEEALALLEQNQIWVQIVNKQGKEIFQYKRPAFLPASYSYGDLIHEINKSKAVKYETGTIDGEELIWIVGNADPKDEPISQPNQEEMAEIGKDELRGVAYIYSLFGSTLLVTIIVAYFFGQRLGLPLIHMMKWIQALAQGEYDEPKDKKGRPASLSPSSNKMRRPFRTYREVFESLQQLADNLKKNEEDRIRLEKTREEWIAGVSHDLKTPLSSVKGYAKLLAEEGFHWEKEEIQTYSRVIEDKAGHMENLIEDLNLTFRLKNEALPLQKKKENLVEVVRRSVIDLMNSQLGEQHQVEFECEMEDCWIPMDRKWFQRAFNNLLGNAAVHNPPGTIIQVSVGQSDGQLWIQIKDNGVGMDEEMKSHLFERYYRGTNTAQRNGGTGLGMAIAHQLLITHGAKIELESQLGEGTEITIRFDKSVCTEEHDQKEE